MLSVCFSFRIVLRLTWLLNPGFARLMISSTNSLVLFKLQHSLGMDRLLNNNLTMSSNLNQTDFFAILSLIL